MVNSVGPSNATKQACKLGPTLFGIYAAVLLSLAFKKVRHTCCMQIRFHYDGDLFNLCTLKARNKVLKYFSVWLRMTLPYLVTRQKA